MLDNLATILPLIQMLSGNNSNMAEMLKNLSLNSAMPNINSDMLSALTSLMSNGKNSGDFLKNMGGNNMLGMLPFLQSMMNNQKPNTRQNIEPVIETIQTEKKYYNLKPISKIANKEITYLLNQYFAGV